MWIARRILEHWRSHVEEAERGLGGSLKDILATLYYHVQYVIFGWILKGIKLLYGFDNVTWLTFIEHVLAKDDHLEGWGDAV